MNIICLLIHDLKMKYYRTRFDIEIAKSEAHLYESKIWREHTRRSLKWLKKYIDECERYEKKMK